MRAGRVLVAVLSAAVLLVTGYGWSAYHRIDRGLATSDVLGTNRPPDGATDILLVGLDSRTDGHGNPLPQQVLDELSAGTDTGTLNTDTLVLVRVPNDPTAVATAISIPRDSYVDVPGFGTHKINSAYERAMTDARASLEERGVTGADLETQASQAGRRELISTVEQLTGASVDHYAEVNLVGFAEVTRAVGGVPVCLVAPVQDSYSGVDLPAGPQTLEGAQALAFVRQRHGLPRGDLDRIVRQQAFMASLAHQLLSAGTLADPTALAGLISAVDRYIVIDQGWDLLRFATQAQGLTGGNVQFRTIPTGRLALPTPSDGAAVEVNPALVRSFVAGVSSPSAAASADPGTAASSAATVDVENASGRSGLAAAVQSVLDDHGMVPGTLGNAATTARSVVRADAATAAAAAQVARILGGLTVVDDGAVAAGHVKIVLGRDYRGPEVSGSPTSTADPDTPSVGTTPGGTGGADPAASDAPSITAGGLPCVN
jgi:LCP family protein required for cell wall assembly